jgi:acyl carrier protein
MSESMSDTNTVEMREIVLRVLGNIAPEVDLASLDPDANLRDQMDIDSVDFLTFAIRLHKELGIEIPDSDVPKLLTLNSCVSYLIGRTGKS